MRRVLTILAVISCLLTGFSTTVGAQSLPGAENQLPFHLDDGKANNWDRYILKIPQQKMKLAVAQFSITYPNYYKGIFDTKAIAIKVRGKKVPLSEVKWNQEARIIEIFRPSTGRKQSGINLI